MGRPRRDDAEFFYHDTDANADLKLKYIKNKFGMAGVGTYWTLLEFIGSSANAELEWNDVQACILAEEFSFSEEEFNSFIQHAVKVKLFTIKDGYLFSEGLKKRLNGLFQKRQMMRERYDFKQKPDSGVSDAETSRNQQKPSETRISDAETSRNQQKSEFLGISENFCSFPQEQNRTEQNRTEQNRTEQNSSSSSSSGNIPRAHEEKTTTTTTPHPANVVFQEKVFDVHDKDSFFEWFDSFRIFKAVPLNPKIPEMVRRIILKDQIHPDGLHPERLSNSMCGQLSVQLDQHGIDFAVEAWGEHCQAVEGFETFRGLIAAIGFHEKPKQKAGRTRETPRDALDEAMERMAKTQVLEVEHGNA
ncbi:MAG: DUF4373 domain-containing protein [SAR324 cluster bacterium]|nr:DUF4373 domain-containing protein [SAR324 cluster bacterium]